MEMQHRDVAHWLLRVIGFVRPCVGSSCFRMPMQIEYFNDSFPHRLALEFLLYGHALNVHSFRAMQSADYVPQFFDVWTYSHLCSASLNSKRILKLLFLRCFRICPMASAKLRFAEAQASCSLETLCVGLALQAIPQSGDGQFAGMRMSSGDRLSRMPHLQAMTTALISSTPTTILCSKVILTPRLGFRLSKNLVRFLLPLRECSARFHAALPDCSKRSAEQLPLGNFPA